MFAQRETGAGVPLGTVLAAALAYAVGAASNALVYLGMRAVMGVGGSCADGGPYVSAQSCPDGVGVAMGLGIPVMILTWFAATYLGGRVGGIWGNAMLIGWVGLFGSLGWNFLDAGLFSAPPEYGIAWGAVICGVVFWIMAAGGLLGLLGVDRLPVSGSKRGRSRSSGGASPEAVRYDYGGPIHLQPADGTTSQVAGFQDPHVVVQPAADDSAALVRQLERLGEMRERQLLTDDEYETAKAAVMHELEERR